MQPDVVTAELAAVGFCREALTLRPGGRREQACLLVRKAAESPGATDR
ncbi:hypothetical protein [Streptacidiphilus pinicola]|nr:hypothetical protein [Streptacidiphilus pinicola]